MCVIILKELNKILEGVCNAYTEKEQGERIEKILKFPMKLMKDEHITIQ